MKYTSMKEIDELERLVVERLRLELARCDLWDEEVHTPKSRTLTEQYRAVVRSQAELWFELVPLLRQQQRIRRLKAADKQAARVKL